LHGEQLLASPSFSAAHKPPCPFCCVSFSIPCLLFSFCVYVCVQCGSAKGAMLIYPRGDWVNTACCLFAHLLVCIS
jgi:hypothetical protein